MPGRLRLILSHSDKGHYEDGTPLVVLAQAGTQELSLLRPVRFSAERPMDSRLRGNDDCQQRDRRPGRSGFSLAALRRDCPGRDAWERSLASKLV